MEVFYAGWKTGRPETPPERRRPADLRFRVTEKVNRPTLSAAPSAWSYPVPIGYGTDGTEPLSESPDGLAERRGIKPSREQRRATFVPKTNALPSPGRPADIGRRRRTCMHREIKLQF